ncbi:MAG TPA: hypothetical protein VMS43_12210 [Allosphingosinicella sp.]|nr:hypothetical protein [Allosphingosinicella sp.]
MSEAQGPGERRERARRNRRLWIIAGAFAIGLVAGFASGFHDGGRPFEPGAPWPPAMAIAIAASYLVAAVGGGILLARHTDEVALQNQYKAVAVGALCYVIAYPIWFALWMGALLPEPIHLALFILFMAATMLASLYYRFR